MTEADVAAYTQQTETDAAALGWRDSTHPPSAARVVCSSSGGGAGGLTAQSSTHLLASAADAYR